MDDEKVWYQSRSVIGSAVTILALICGLFNLTVDAQTQSDIVNLTVVVVGVVGSAISIWGRVTATKTIAGKAIK